MSLEMILRPPGLVRFGVGGPLYCRGSPSQQMRSWRARFLCAIYGGGVKKTEKLSTISPARVQDGSKLKSRLHTRNNQGPTTNDVMTLRSWRYS